MQWWRFLLEIGFHNTVDKITELSDCQSICCLLSRCRPFIPWNLKYSFVFFFPSVIKTEELNSDFILSSQTPVIFYLNRFILLNHLHSASQVEETFLSIIVAFRSPYKSPRKHACSVSVSPPHRQCFLSVGWSGNLAWTPSLGDAGTERGPGML